MCVGKRKRNSRPEIVNEIKSVNPKLAHSHYGLEASEATLHNSFIFDLITEVNEVTL